MGFQGLGSDWLLLHHERFEHFCRKFEQPISCLISVQPMGRLHAVFPYCSGVRVSRGHYSLCSIGEPLGPSMPLEKAYYISGPKNSFKCLSTVKFASVMKGLVS